MVGDRHDSLSVRSTACRSIMCRPCSEIRNDDDCHFISYMYGCRVEWAGRLFERVAQAATKYCTVVIYKAHLRYDARGQVFLASVSSSGDSPAFESLHSGSGVCTVFRFSWEAEIRQPRRAATIEECGGTIISGGTNHRR